MSSYSALDIARALNAHNVKLQEALPLLDRIWSDESSYLLPKYQKNARVFRRAVLYCIFYLAYIKNKKAPDAEFTSIKQQCRELGIHLRKSDYVLEVDKDNKDDYLKEMRLNIRYFQGEGYCRLKLRSLLDRFGYKTRTKDRVRWLKTCLRHYGITTYLRGNVECDLGKVLLDDMITFRVRV